MEEEIKRFTEQLYNETFGNGQGTLDEFDWEDIATVIEETAHHFVNWQKEHQPHWKPSEEQMEQLQRAINCYESDWGENKVLRSLINELKKLM